MSDKKQFKPKEAKVVKRKQPPMTEHPIINRVKVNGVWLEKGNKVKLTKEGLAFFRSKKYVK